MKLDLDKLRIRLRAQQEQELAGAVNWMRRQLEAGEEGQEALQHICNLATRGTPAELREQRDDLLLYVQRFAWLGVIAALESYTTRREEEKWA